MNIFTMESVNLVCGDNDAGQPQPGSATFLSLRQLKLPNMEENYVEHVPGGGIAAIEIYTHINKLEATFTLAGMQPRVMGLLARGNVSREAQRYTAYGVVREQRTGAPMSAVAVMYGRVGSVNPTAIRRGDLMEHEFSIKGITRYKFTMQEDRNSPPTVVYDYDFFNNTLIVDGHAIYEQENGILGLFSAQVGLAETG
jgi:phage tail tube protein FII